MILEREITVEGNVYCVVLSDEREALLAAKAAGRVLVGLTGKNGQEMLPVRYAAQTPEAADDRYLERVVRREMGLPWLIGESERLLLREFTLEDLEWIPREGGSRADRVFYTRELLEAYIREQYGFYEYGMWAVVRRKDGTIIGKAGVSDCDVRRSDRQTNADSCRSDGQTNTDSCRPGGRNGSDAFQTDGQHPDMQLELGYHIFVPYRRQGYAEEACRMILQYVAEEYGCPLYAVTARDNLPSVRLLKKLGFTAAEQRCSEEAPQHLLFVRNC